MGRECFEDLGVDADTTLKTSDGSTNICKAVNIKFYKNAFSEVLVVRVQT
jgi:hypothetical protein